MYSKYVALLHFDGCSSQLRPKYYQLIHFNNTLNGNYTDSANNSIFIKW